MYNMNNTRLEIVRILYPGEFSCGFAARYPEGTTNREILAQVFDEWNDGSGKEGSIFKYHHVRSLSVNDIVQVGVFYYQCKPCGWEKVSRRFAEQINEEVRNRPSPKKVSAWGYLHNLMESKYKADPNVWPQPWER